MKKQNKEEKEETKQEKPEEKVEEMKEKAEEAKEEKIEETRQEKQGEKAKEEKKIKTEAIVRVNDLPISTKHSIAICDFIRGKKLEQVISELEKVVKLKKAIKMKGEIPHRKGMERGRYPVNASKVFIKLIKSLNANSTVNGLENPIISMAKADVASRPYKRGGRERFKRTNVVLIAKEKVEKSEGKK